MNNDTSTIVAMEDELHLTKAALHTAQSNELFFRDKTAELTAQNEQLRLELTAASLNLAAAAAESSDGNTDLVVAAQAASSPSQSPSPPLLEEQRPQQQSQQSPETNACTNVITNTETGGGATELDPDHNPNPTTDAATSTTILTDTVTLSHYKRALNVSETERQQLLQENASLRQRLAATLEQQGGAVACVQAAAVAAGVGVGVDADGVGTAAAVAAVAAMSGRGDDGVVIDGVTGVDVDVHMKEEDGVGLAGETIAGVVASSVHTSRGGGVVGGIGIGWGYMSQEEAWAIKFSQLACFKVEHGHCQVPYNYVYNPTLAKWVQRQKSIHRSHKGLKIERREKLQDLGFFQDSQFGQKQEEEEENFMTVGHAITAMVDPSLNIDTDAHTAAGIMSIFTPEIAQVFSPVKAEFAPSSNVDSADDITVSSIISTHTNDPTTMISLTTPHRTNPTLMPTNMPTPSVPTGIAILGFTSRSDEKWEQHFQRLQVYKNEHGNCLVPTSTELGRWLCRQRHGHRYKGLKEVRKVRLMELDDTCLGERVLDLNSVVNPIKPPSQAVEGREGQTILTHHYPTPDYHSKANPTRPQHKTLVHKTKYNQAYESKLHQKWTAYYHQLLNYKSFHGHCNYPTMNGTLGRWISRQRTLYRSQKLKSDRYHKLAQLGFAFEDASALEFQSKLDGQWEVMYTDLVRHKERVGHCFDVPETEALGRWLYRQRWLYRHGNLRKDRSEKLLVLGFDDKKQSKRDLEALSSSLTSTAAYIGSSKKRQRSMDSAAVTITPVTIAPATRKQTLDNTREHLKEE